MKGSTFMVIKKIEEDGTETKIEKLHKTFFDQNELLSFTLIEHMDSNEPEYIHIVTKEGISMDLSYEENLYIDLTKHFREKGLL